MAPRVHLSSGRISKLIAKLSEDPRCLELLRVSILGYFGPERVMSLLWAGSQQLPGHRASQAAGKAISQCKSCFSRPISTFPHFQPRWTHYQRALALPVCLLNQVLPPCLLTPKGRLLGPGEAPHPLTMVPTHLLPWLASFLSLANKVHFASDDASCSHHFGDNDAYKRRCFLSIYYTPRIGLNPLHTLVLY